MPVKETGMSGLALEGVRVLDLSRVLAGPFCAMILADLGAEVIKIEMPGSGDDSRRFGPFINGESGYFMNVNRNKKGITLNLKEGKDIFLDLVKKADIVVENYRPGVMERLGLGYDELSKVNPRLIYGCVSGFGHTGPYAMRPGYDVIGQAASGIMSVTGWPGGEPTRIGTAMSDTLAGYSLAIGLLAALHSRGITGKGQKVDIGIMDAGVASLQIVYPIYTMGGRIPERIGNRYESNYPTDSFRSKDGMYVVSAANDKLWQNTCKAIGKPEAAFESRFLTNPDRVKNHSAVKEIIEAWSKSLSSEEAVSILIEYGVPAQTINNLARVVNDPHAAAREMFKEVEHPIAGKTLLNNSHIKMSDTKAEVRTPAPTLGQHNEEIFSKLLDINKEALNVLINEGVI
jgi:formyl-CoA transferase